MPLDRPRLRRLAAPALAAALAVLAGCGDAEPTAPPPLVGSLDADFEGGSLAGWTGNGQGEFDLMLAAAPGGIHHYYAFRVRDRAGLTTDFRILNAQSATWESAWAVERPAVSEDGGRTWRRIDQAFYTGFYYRFRYTPATDDAWIATLPPYRFSDWLDRMDGVVAEGRADVVVDTLGWSRDGHPVHRLVVDDPARGDRPSLWIIARQHADEMPGSWMADGFLEWVLGPSAEAAALRDAVVVHLVPFMNPDGAVRGYQRVNTAGLDLNRVWHDPDPATAPTVAAARAAIRADHEDGSPVALFIDLHGDPGNRKNYAYAHGRTAEERAATERFTGAMEARNDLFWAAGTMIIEVRPLVAMGWATGELGIVGYTVEGAHHDIVHGPHAGRFMGPDDWRGLGVSLGETLAETLATTDPRGARGGH